jgi:acetyl-CoA carboxylase carboxyl transferase subunit alpha
MAHGWDFEKPIIELESKIEELKKFAKDKKVNLSFEIENLDKKLSSLKREVYSALDPWQKVQIARHPKRPTTLDYVSMIVKDFLPLHGDRLFGDDKALVCGFGRIDEKNFMIIGHQKGRDTKENIYRNFGCAHPEGYRKAMRMMHLAQRFGSPVLCLIDTPGAYPGIGAEERGQAIAVAENIRDMFGVKTPIISVIIGEGGSGGALGIGVGDRVMMMEHSYYSVISPEGCAAILWKDASKREQASRVLKLTGKDLLGLGIIDEVIPEPQGGAHKNAEVAASNLKASVLKNLYELESLTGQQLVSRRYDKFRKIGVYKE